ncbi:hypothetical protein WISP_125133 [Willisornis vidua]|uniref:Uncharacterized protein n=1 Tax=Willisornis vidua TaxID=1566151 RepID=A0ABQ9CRI6_9PASS|nr:hypothetical protein WISP_125133 [Willisornis vidua]
MGYQLFQLYAVGDSVKGFAEIQIDHIHSLSLVHQVGHLMIKEISYIKKAVSAALDQLGSDEGCGMKCVL